MSTAPHIRLVLWKSAKAIDNVDRESIADTGLQLSEFAIMEVLLHKGPLPINAIGRKVLLTSGSMTAAINRLGEKGFVRRVQDTADGRIFHVHLTAIGRTAIQSAYKQHAANLEQVAAALSPAERTELVRLLKKIGRHAEQVPLKEQKRRTQR